MHRVHIRNDLLNYLTNQIITVPKNLDHSKTVIMDIYFCFYSNAFISKKITQFL